MTKVCYDADADGSLLTGKKITIVGYRSQGHRAHAQPQGLRYDVTVGVRPFLRGLEAG